MRPNNPKNPRIIKIGGENQKEINSDTLIIGNGSFMRDPCYFVQTEVESLEKPIPIPKRGKKKR